MDNLSRLMRYVRANTANAKYNAPMGVTNKKVIAAMVAEEGYDAAAEERIVLRLVERKPPKNGWWINTDLMRHVIRTVQGRKRREIRQGEILCPPVCAWTGDTIVRESSDEPSD